MLTILKLFLGTSISFLKDNWKAVAVAILVGLLVWLYNDHVDSLTKAAYDKGVADQKAICDETLAKMKRDHEKYVTKAEADAKAAADELERLRSTTKKTIADLNRKLDEKSAELNRYVYGRDGKPLPCTSETGEIYLGSAFAEQWNTYNKEILE